MSQDTQYKAGATYLRLLSYTKRFRVFLYIAVFGMIVQACANGFFVKQVQPLVEEVFVSRDPDAIIYVPIMLFLAILARAIGTIIGGYFMACVSWGVIRDLRKEVFDQFLVTPTSVFDNTSSGVSISKVTYNISQVATAASKAITIIIQEGLTAIVLLYIMLTTSYQLVFAFLVVIPIMFVIIELGNKAARRYSKRIQDSVGDVAHLVSQVMNAHRIIKIFNGMDIERERFRETIDYNRAQQLKLTLIESLISPFTQILIGISLALIVYIAASDFIGDPLSPGAFMTFFFALAGLFAPLKSLTKVNVEIQKAVVAAQSVFYVIDSEKEKDLGSYEVDSVNGDIKFNDVVFRYQNAEDDALKSISFDVKAGQTVALVGQSGSGKTTLASLLPRFYDLNSGEIKLDGSNIQDYSLVNLRSQISYVGQDLALFDDTVLNNIAYGDLADKSENEIQTAIKAARADIFIASLPQGIHSKVGEGGSLLSGGQRQRIAIARALLKDSPILILDEATSALDSESESHIQAALNELMVGRTTLVIAHRLSTIENADKIIVLDQGQIVEQGSHEELLEQQGAYARLHAIQFGTS